MADIDYGGGHVPAEVLERILDPSTDTAAFEHWPGCLPTDGQNGQTIHGEMLVLMENNKNHALLKKVGAACGKLAVFSLAAAGIGAGFATADAFRTPSRTTAGPGVDVEFTPTRDSALTFKVALGAEIVKPLPMKETHGLGAKVEITSLPDPDKLGLSNLGADDKQASILSSVLGDSEHIVAQAKHGAWEHWKGLWEFWAGAGLATELVAARFLERRRSDHEAGPPHRKLIAATVGACVLFGSVNINLVNDSAFAKARGQPADTLFNGVPFLEGSHLSGTYNEQLRPLLTRVANTLRTNARFYDEITKNYQEAILARPLLQATPGTRTMMMLANSHCDFYMNPIDRMVAKDAGVGILGLNGDMVIGGIESVDKACLDSLAYNFRGLGVVYVDGNHTDAGLPEHARNLGWYVLDGSVTDVKGWRFIGASDGRQSLIGESIQQVGPPAEAQKQNLAETACNDPRGVDIIMVPLPDMAHDTLARGCAKLGLGGNRTEKLTWVAGLNGLLTPVIEGSNAGGVVDNKFTLGNTLQAPATIVLMKAAEQPFAPQFLQVITFNPDASVNIGPIQSLNAQANAAARNTSTR